MRGRRQIRKPASAFFCSRALRRFRFELHSPVAGEVRRDVKIGRIGLKSFGRDLQLESAEAGVRKLKESMLIGFR